MLMKKVDEYLALRRAAGYALEVPEYHLRNFARFAARRGETLICTPTVIEWAADAAGGGASSISAWTRKRRRSSRST